MKELDLTSFDNEVNAHPICLVDFWAEWCAPCRSLSLVLEELSKEYEGKVKFFKVNVDENPELAARFRITSLPTLVIFKMGEPVDKVTGAVPKQIIRKFLDSHL